MRRYREITKEPDRRITLLFAVSAALALSLPVAAGEMTTPTYRIPQTTVSTSGSRLQTPTYLVDTAAGQECTVGTATTASYIVQSGFLNSQSTNPVPVELIYFEIVQNGPDGFTAFTAPGPEGE